MSDKKFRKPRCADQVKLRLDLFLDFMVCEDKNIFIDGIGE